LRPFLRRRGRSVAVAGRFALVALGGELASAWLLTEWPAGEATEAVEACFRAWLVERGTVGAQEHARAVTQPSCFHRSAWRGAVRGLEGSRRATGATGGGGAGGAARALQNRQPDRLETLGATRRWRLGLGLALLRHT